MHGAGLRFGRYVDTVHDTPVKLKFPEMSQTSNFSNTQKATGYVPCGFSSYTYTINMVSLKTPECQSLVFSTILKVSANFVICF